MNRIDVLKGAITEFGEELQCTVMVEEMAELTKALCKLKRGGSIKDVLEEMADVQIMLDQMKLIFGDTSSMEEIKLKKLELRLDMKRIFAGTKTQHEIMVDIAVDKLAYFEFCPVESFRSSTCTDASIGGSDCPDCIRDWLFRNASDGGAQK